MGPECPLPRCWRPPAACSAAGLGPLSARAFLCNLALPAPPFLPSYQQDLAILLVIALGLVSVLRWFRIFKREDASAFSTFIFKFLLPAAVIQGAAGGLARAEGGSLFLWPWALPAYAMLALRRPGWSASALTAGAWRPACMAEGCQHAKRAPHTPPQHPNSRPGPEDRPVR